MKQLPEHRDEISQPDGSGEEDYEVLERLKTDLQKVDIKMIKRERFLGPPPRKEYELARCDDEYLGLFKEWTLLRRKVHSIEGQKETVRQELEGLEIDLNEVRIKMICRERELGLSDNLNLYNLARTDDQYFGLYEQELQLKGMIQQKRVQGHRLALPSDGAQFDAYSQHSPAAMERDLAQMSQQSTPAALPDFKGLLEYLVHENRIEAPAGGAVMEEDSGYGTAKPSDLEDTTQQDTGALSSQNRATTSRAASGQAAPGQGAPGQGAPVRATNGEATRPVPPVLELDLRGGEPDHSESVSVTDMLISRRRRRSRHRRSSSESAERQQTVQPTKKPRTDGAKQNREGVAKSGGVCAPCRVTNSQCSGSEPGEPCLPCVERKKNNEEDPIVNICVRPTFRDKDYFEIGEPLTCYLTPGLFINGQKAPKPEPSNFTRVHTLRQDLNEQASLAICFSEASLLKQISLSRPLIARLNYLYQRVVELSWSKKAAQKRCELMQANTGLNIFIKTNTVLAEGPYVHQQADCYFVFSVAFERVKSELERLRAVTSMHALTVLERALTPSNLEKANTFTVILFVALLYQEILLQKEAAAIFQVDTQSIRHRSLIALDTHLLTWLRLLVLKAYKRDCPLIRLLSRDSEMLILREDYWQQWLWESGRLMKLKLMPLPGGVESANEGEELPALVMEDSWTWYEHTNVGGQSASTRSTDNANHNRQPGSTTSRTRANNPANKAAKGPRRVERFKDIASAIRKESKHIVLDYTDLKTNARRVLAKIGSVIQNSSFGLIKAKRQDGEKALMEQADFNALGCPFD